MRTRTAIAAVAVLTMVLVAGCMGDTAPGQNETPTSNESSPDEMELSAEEIQNRSVAAANNVSSYRFDVTMQMNMSIAGEQNGSEVGFTTSATSNGTGAANLSTQSLRMEMTQHTAAPDFDETNVSNASALPGTAQQGFDTRQTSYLLNGTIYTKTEFVGDAPANASNMTQGWMKIELPRQFREMWSQQNQLAQQRQYLNYSEDVERLDDATVDGVETYVLHSSLSGEAMRAVMQDQMASTPFSGMFGEDAITVHAFSATQWLAKDTYYPHRSHVTMNYTMRPGRLNFSAVAGNASNTTANASTDAMESAMGNMTFTIDMTMEMAFSGFDEPVTIELPAEARNASSTLSGGFGAMMNGSAAADTPANGNVSQAT